MTIASRYQNPMRPRPTPDPPVLTASPQPARLLGVKGSWGVVVPVKRLELAKTRLSSYGEQARQDLALAFAADVVTAARQVAEVVVVTDDQRAEALLAALGARVVPDDPDAGLNPALQHGADLLSTDVVATLSSDLPALRAEDIAEVLDHVTAGARVFVPDIVGTGTTLLAAGTGAVLAPAYGPSSRDAHLRSGAHEVVAGVSLRQDVDTPDDLRTVVALGVGAHTRAVLAGLGMAALQGTVRDWGPDGGSAFLDDGSVVALPAESLGDGPFRALRLGQRVGLMVADDVALRVELP
jgi:2-phospho-L-lactate guanylyltransferase